MHKQQQQQQEQEERLSSGSLAAAYCIGLLTPTTSHTAATIAFDYSHILLQLHLQSWTNIIWNWWEFGKTKSIFFILKSTKFSLVWTFWADLWHLSNEGSLICFHDVCEESSQHWESVTQKVWRRRFPPEKFFFKCFGGEILYLWHSQPISSTVRCSLPHPIRWLVFQSIRSCTYNTTMLCTFISHSVKVTVYGWSPCYGLWNHNIKYKF